MPKLLNCLIFLRFAVFWQTCQACNETETPCLVKKKRVKIERIINHQQQNLNIDFFKKREENVQNLS